MTEAEALEWAGSLEGAAKVLAIVRRWEALGYEPQVSLTRKGDLGIWVSVLLSAGKEEEDDEQGPHGPPSAGG